MQRLLVVLPRPFAIRILPLGHSVPCRIVAAVILAVVSGASFAADRTLAPDPQTAAAAGHRTA